MVRFSSALLLAVAFSATAVQAQDMGFFESLISSIFSNRVARACASAIARIEFEDVKFEDYFDCGCDAYFGFGEGFGAIVNCDLKEAICLPNTNGTDSTNCGQATLEGLYGGRIGGKTTMCLEFESEGAASAYDGSSLCIDLVNADLPDVANFQSCEVRIKVGDEENTCTECSICDAEGTSPSDSGQDLTFDCSNINVGDTALTYPSIKPVCIGATTIRNLANATQNMPFAF